MIKYFKIILFEEVQRGWSGDTLIRGAGDEGKGGGGRGKRGRG